VKAYSVTLWGSHPDLVNDDCWTGDDFDSHEEALVCYRELTKRPWDHPLGKSCGHWEFMMIDGPGVHEIIANPDQKTCQRKRRELAREDREWRREIANEAGMLYGIEAYNDAMGYGP
jgi:hypothetical protein